MPDSTAKKIATKAPTSFSLEPDLLYRFKNACAQRQRKQSDVVGEVLESWISKPATPAANPVAELPGPFAGLSDDQIWTAQNLIDILRHQPRGAIFHTLDRALADAISEFRAGQSTSGPRQSIPKTKETRPLRIDISNSTESLLQSDNVSIEIPQEDAQWVQQLLKVLHSDKPGLQTALQNNLHEFEWANEAWHELQQRESPLASPAAARPGRGAPSKLTALARTGGDRHGDRAPEADISARIDKAQKTAGQGKRSPARVHDKTS